jgi:hypothetical protein
MPAPTYTPLANITLGSAQATVVFSSISSAYRDLILVINGRSNHGAEDFMNFRLNSDSGSNYSNVYMRGNGSTATSGSSTGTSGIDASFSGSAFDNVVVLNFMDYSATDKHKTVLTRLNSASLSTWGWATRWASTSAVTSITFDLFSGSFDTGTTMALYGVAA